MVDGSVEPLTRFACKMATGSGKTVVMAMIITWAFCNRARVPSDDRFPNAVLVCCPNLTIKERLQVLRMDSRGDDYYTQFDLVAPPTATFCEPARSWSRTGISSLRNPNTARAARVTPS